MTIPFQHIVLSEDSTLLYELHMKAFILARIFDFQFLL
jgi:hypothetical protein